MIRGIYSVTVPGQQPVAAAEASDFGQQPASAAASPDFGQQPGAASPAQQGLSQSGGQVFFGQQPGVPSTAQHGLLGSSGHVFVSDPHSAFRGHSPSVFSAKKACEAVHVALFVA